MKIHQTIILAVLALTLGGVGLGLALAKKASDDRPLAHMVFFELKEDSASAQKQLVAACHKYLTGHDGTIYFSVGVRAKELDRGVNVTDFDVALHLVFKDKAAHDKYQKAPRHIDFIENAKHLWKGVRVFDSYLTSAK